MIDRIIAVDKDGCPRIGPKTGFIQSVWDRHCNMTPELQGEIIRKRVQLAQKERDPAIRAKAVEMASLQQAGLNDYVTGTKVVIGGGGGSYASVGVPAQSGAVATETGVVVDLDHEHVVCRDRSAPEPVLDLEIQRLVFTGTPGWDAGDLINEIMLLLNLRSTGVMTMMTLTSAKMAVDRGQSVVFCHDGKGEPSYHVRVTAAGLISGLNLGEIDGWLMSALYYCTYGSHKVAPMKCRIEEGCAEATLRARPVIALFTPAKRLQGDAELTSPPYEFGEGKQVDPPAWAELETVSPWHGGRVGHIVGVRGRAFPAAAYACQALGD